MDTWRATDSRFLTEDMDGMIPNLAQKMAHKFGFTKNVPVHAEQVINNSKVSDHHAIIPTVNVADFSFISHEIGLLFGNVQSGKTGQMFGIISKATDLGFPVFVLLTTDNVVLQQQTLDRVKADLDGYCICGENDAKTFTDNCLIQPTIIVLKKNARILKLWANIFNSTGFMRGNPLFIVDDEADAASLNTLVNKDCQSSINKYLDMIKNGSSSSIYLQVTGTPQAIFLQTLESGWHPYFTYYFQPGASYLGGDFFFPSTGKPDCVNFLEEIEKTTKAVVIRHIAVASQVLASGGKVANCLFHPSVRQAAHKKYADEIVKEIVWCVENRDGEFKDEIEREYHNLEPTKKDRVSFDQYLQKAFELIDGKAIQVLIMNGKTDIDRINDLNLPENVLHKIDFRFIPNSCHMMMIENPEGLSGVLKAIITTEL